jgi:hypothetical protein
MNVMGTIEPVVVSAKVMAGKLYIALSSGLGLNIDTKSLPSLEGVRVDGVKISHDGAHLVFGDVEIPLAQLIVDLIGESAIKSEMARRLGSVTSKAKKEAARKNARLGGRPPKEGADPKRRERYLALKAKKAAEQGKGEK